MLVVNHLLGLGVSLRTKHSANQPPVRMILSVWFDHLVEGFSSKNCSVQQFLSPCANQLSSY